MHQLGLSHIIQMSLKPYLLRLGINNTHNITHAEFETWEIDLSITLDYVLLYNPLVVIGKNLKNVTQIHLPLLFGFKSKYPDTSSSFFSRLALQYIGLQLSSTEI